MLPGPNLPVRKETNFLSMRTKNTPLIMKNTTQHWKIMSLEPWLMEGRDLSAFDELNCETLRNIIKYYYEENVVGLGSMPKESLVHQVSTLFTKYSGPQVAV